MVAIVANAILSFFICSSIDVCEDNGKNRQLFRGKRRDFYEWLFSVVPTAEQDAPGMGANLAMERVRSLSQK